MSIGLMVATLMLDASHRSAAAATATGNFTVSATVQATCSITTGNLAFGTYTGALVTATATLIVTCTNTTPYNIGFNAGTGSGATVTTRKMTGPASAVLSYGLFRDGAFTLNWGSTAGTDTDGGTGNGSAQSYIAYGNLGAGQLVRPGAYTDTITATLTY